jgi:hypothetical protein
MMGKVSVALRHLECNAMKSIRFDVLRGTFFVFFVSLLLLASAIQAQTVNLDGTTATSIEGLQVNQT